MVAGGLVGVVIGLIALRLEGDYLAIVTLFVGQAFVEVVNNVDPGTLGGVNGIFGLDSLHGLSGNVTTPARLLLRGPGRSSSLLAAVLHLLDTSRTGRAWRALRDDPLAAAAMTMPVNKLKVMAFSFSAAIGALGGALFAAQQSSVFPTNFTVEHPDPDLRLPGARRRREHRRRDRRRNRRAGRSSRCSPARPTPATCSTG